MDGLKEGARLAVGSMPHMDALVAAKANCVVFPEIPAWPQLPRKSPMEQMTRQGLAGLPGLSWPSTDKPIFNTEPPDLAEALAKLSSDNQEGRFDRAAFTQDEAPGFYEFMKTAPRLLGPSTQAVKGQCVGPVTLGMALKDEEGKPLLSSRVGMEVLKQYLLLHARWQVSRLATLGKPVVFFFDEPAMGRGFNPRDHGTQWIEVQGWLSELLEALQEDGVMTGLHCCGEGPWDWVFDTPAELFHLDGFHYLDRVLERPAGFQKFLQSGGTVVWGMVPTTMEGGTFPDPALLLDRWMGCANDLIKKGLRQEDLLGRAFFSTSCGLGASSMSVAEAASRCLSDFVSLWKVSIKVGFGK